MLAQYKLTDLNDISCLLQVFNCYWDTAFIYVFGELFGALLAAACVLPLYGVGQFGSLFDTRLFEALGMRTPKHFALPTEVSMHVGAVGS